MHPIASFIGQVVGGCLGIFLLAALIEWIAVKRLMDNAAVGWLVAVGMAYVLAVIVYGFGKSNGNGWVPDGIVFYLPGAIIVGFAVYLRRRSEANREFM